MHLDFGSAEIRNLISGAEFGMEKESLRITPDGHLSHTAHPFGGDKNIDRDFCENQIEIISNVFDSADSLLSSMESIHSRIYQTLSDHGELLWPFSNPPKVRGEEDIPVASFTGEFRDKSVYRRYLAEKYGKLKMLFSGIHFNFSFTREFIDAAFVLSGSSDKAEFKDQLYLELAQKLVEYNWLIVYLTSASPLMDSSFIKCSGFGSESATAYASVRCSKIGYWNDFIPVLDYSSVAGYIRSVKKYIDDGRLKSVSELYYPVRIKPRGKNTLEALAAGINHIELRTLDLNPLARCGIMKEDIEFIHFMMIYLMSIDHKTLSESSQIAAVLNIKNAAMYDDINHTVELSDGTVPLRKAALDELDKILHFSQDYFPQFVSSVKYQIAKLSKPGGRYAEQIRERFGDDYIRSGLELAKKYLNNREAV